MMVHFTSTVFKSRSSQFQWKSPEEIDKKSIIEAVTKITIMHRSNFKYESVAPLGQRRFVDL